MEMVVAEELFAGGGEMGTLMRSLDWSQTLLGSVSEWAQSLKTAVSIILTSRYPMFIWWGAEYANLYNDAYRPILGASKHPQFLGQSAKECWADVWDVVGPLADSVLTTGQPTWSEDLLLLMDRNGYLEETYFTFSYSPVRDESGGVGGVFCAVTETTGRIIGERRLRTLRELATKTAEAKTVEEACHIVTTTLSINPYDIPFALLYRVELDGKQARLAGTTGIEVGTVASPQQVDLFQESEADRWNLARVNRTGKAELVNDLPQRFGGLPKGAWSEEPTKALVIPITQSGKAQRRGLLVVGISPRREFDDDYQGFFDLIASNVATAIANADAYEAERKRAAALAELDRAKTTFFSNISHEFRTPLTLMLGSLEETLAGNEPLSTHQREQLEAAQRNSLRLLKLVNTLLDFSRFEAGRIQAVYEPTDLATFTRELASVFRSAIERAGMQLVVDCLPLPEAIYVDREMWEKIILNLLSNAFKFTFEGKITVALRWCTDHVELDVSDTGIGIPENELPRLFERFHRVPGARGRTYEGSGIGLSLVQELVRLHGGTLRVASFEGQGSCFTVSIPAGSAHLPQNQIDATRTLTSTATQAAAYVEEALRWLPEESGRVEEWESGRTIENSPHRPISPSPHLPLTYSASSARILLVDDNADMRDYVRRLLSRDYEVEAVSDGLAALDAVQRHLPDLVLTDVMMPGLDGLGLLRSLRNDPATQNIPIILLSARAGEESRVEGLEAGADDYLIKPFSARELLARIRTNLELARLRRESVRYQEQLRVEVQAAQTQVSNILESITDAFVAFDREWRYAYVNEYATQLLRKKREELLGKHVWTEVFPELVGTQTYWEFHRAVAEKLPIVFEKFSELMGIWTEVNAYPSPDGLAVYFRDITYRKQAEQALRESEERFRQLTENIGTVFFMSEGFSETSPGRIAYVSPAYERIWGRSCESLYQNTRSWFEAVHPDDRERIGQALPGIARAEFDVEFRIVRPDGEIRWVHDRVFPVYNEQGEIYRTAGIVEDITERKQIEEALQQQEAQLRLITDTVPVLISFVDAEQRYRFNNRTYEEWFGHPASEVYGKHIRDVLGEPAYARVLPYVEQVLAGQQITFENEIFYQDGRIRYVSATYVPRFDRQGNVEGFVGLVSDISDVYDELRLRKQAEIALQKSEEQARLAIKVGRLGTWCYNLHTDLVELDKRMREIWGEPDNAETIPLSRVMERIHPDDCERVAIALGAALDPVSSGTYEIDYRIVWDDGTQRWISANGQVQFEGEGEPRQPVGFFGTALDITDQKRAEDELRRSEQRLQLAQQAGRIGTWEWNLLTNEVSWSDGIWTILGIKPGSITPSLESFVKFLHPDEQELILQRVEIALAQGDYYYDEFRVFRQDGTICWFLSKGQVIRAQDGQPERLLGINVDITDRKQAEEALRNSAERLSFALAAAKLGDWSWDAQTDLVTFSQRSAEIFGIPPAPYMTWTQMRNLLHEADREWARLQVEIAIAEHSDYDIEYRVIHPDGIQRWVAAKGRAQFDATGQVLGMLGVVQDITGRKQAEEALRQSEERLRLAMEGAQMGTWDVDLITGKAIWSDQHFTMLGYEPTPTAEASEAMWYSRIHPEDRERVTQEWQQSRYEHRLYRAEYRVIRADTQQIAWLAALGSFVYNPDVEAVRSIGVLFDITDRKRTEVALRESESRFRKIADNSPIVIWMSAPDGAGVWFNQQWCEFTGQTLDEALGSGWLAAVHPEDAQSIETTCLQAHQRHEPVRLEYRLRRQDGEYRWVFDSAVARFDDTGVYLGYIGSIIDITERKQAETELQQTFQTLSTLINASPLAIVVIEPNMTVQLWNPAAEQLFGWSAAEVLGQLIPIVPEEKRDECREIQEAVAKGEVFAGVETYRCKRDGATVIVSISAAPLYNEQGSLNAILLIFQDITQRQRVEQALRQSEERYRCLTESIPQLVWTTNAQGVLLDVNQRWLDYTGLTLAQAQIEGWQAIVHPDDVPILRQNWAIAQQHGTYYQAEGRMRRVDGVYRWYLHQAVPLQNERGQAIKWFGTATDIDDQKQLEQQRDRILQREQAAREEAERANRIKDEFLAVLSHELRSPLNPILGWAKLLQSRTLDEQKTKHALATIERNAKLQTQLIEDLLDVSRILRAKLVLNAVPLNLASTIEAALETVRLAAEAKGIQIQRIVDPNVGQVMGESARLQQVIWNLLSNAVKFTPSGGTIEIRLEQIDTYAHIQVKDTGKGINPEFLPHVFEYFRQEDGTTTRKFGGLGLGLAIVRHLVELHGGTVQADSPGEGQGAIFTVRLPLMPLPSQTPQDNLQTTPVAHLTGLRILVVDDEPDIRDIVAFILEQAGAAVSVATCAPEALNLMEQSLPDVLICDIGMPEMDGYMLMRQIRTLPPEQGGKIPAIALTAYAGEVDQKQALAAGFQQHIAKPVEPDELVRAISALVNR